MMRFLQGLLALFTLFLISADVQGADTPRRAIEPVELIGQASDYFYSRNWRSYYWREDFSFLLKAEQTGKTWRIISREPTPAYGWRMGTTFTDLKIDWKAKPRVKVVGVTGIDRQPAEFYDHKLNEPLVATAFIVWGEAKPNEWKEFYVNNWFHSWGQQADPVIHKYYADKTVPYNIYGFVKGQVAPFDKKSQAIIDKHKDNPSLMFQGRVHASREQPFGFEIELIDLIGRNVKSGGPLVLHGDAKSIPLLDSKKP